MIDNLLNLLFRCSHRRLTRPLTAVSKKGVPHGKTYVVCLDCGKQFDYDLNEMRIGKPVDHSHDACIVPKDMPISSTTKVRFAFVAAAAVPVAIVIRSLFKGKRPRGGTPASPSGTPGVPEGK